MCTGIPWPNSLRSRCRTLRRGAPRWRSRSSSKLTSSTASVPGFIARISGSPGPAAANERSELWDFSPQVTPRTKGSASGTGRCWTWRPLFASPRFRDVYGCPLESRCAWSQVSVLIYVGGTVLQSPVESQDRHSFPRSGVPRRRCGVSQGTTRARGSAKRVVELFAGVGGFHLALRRPAGRSSGRTSGSPRPRRSTLRLILRHFPDGAHVYEDISVWSASDEPA